MQREMEPAGKARYNPTLSFEFHLFPIHVPPTFYTHLHRLSSFLLYPFGMASLGASQVSEPPNTQYPSQSTAFRGQRIWVSPEFGNSFELYSWIVTSHGAELVERKGEDEVFHLLPKFQGVRIVYT